MYVIRTSYAEIKSMSERMLHLTSIFAPWKKDIHFQTSFNHDLALAGLDWDSFLIEYEKQFGLQHLKGLEYYHFFYDVGMDIKWLWSEINRLFTEGKFSIRKKPKKPALTVDDLIASELAGFFVKRKNVKFVLVL